jgi:putative exporter of polyketide antibiotics
MALEDHYWIVEVEPPPFHRVFVIADFDTATGTVQKNESAYNILVTSKRLMISLTCAFVQAFIVSSLESTLPIHLKKIFGYGSGQSGLMFMTLMIPAIFAPLIGKHSTPIPAKF